MPRISGHGSLGALAASIPPVSSMQLFRYSKSIYGGDDLLIGASWDLLPWFAAAGAAFIIVHALVKAAAGRRSRIR